jgi:hypothetical protein
MPNGAIAAVKPIPQDNNQPLIGPGTPLFEWSPGVPIVDDAQAPILQDKDGDIQIPEEEDEHKEHKDEGVDKKTQKDEGASETLFQGEEEPEDLGYDQEDTPAEIEKQEPDNYPIEDNKSKHNSCPDKDASHNESEEQENNANALPDKTQEEHAKAKHDPRNGALPRYNLRPNKTWDYNNRQAHTMDNPANNQSYEARFLQHSNDSTPMLQEAVQEMQRNESDTDVLRCVTGIIMMQMKAKVGIKKHGQVAIDALFNAFFQLHNLGVFRHKHANDLTRAQKRVALQAINVIKEKRYGKIKGRTVANGKGQRSLYTKDETSSATIATDALYAIHPHQR